MGTEILEEEYKDVLAKNDHYKQLIRQQKEHLASLDCKINEAQSRIQERQAASGGRLKQQEKHRHERKHVLILENKLDQETKKFDNLLSKNKAIREDIDHLLKQRGTLCKIHKKLNQQLATQHNIMEELAEMSVNAYNQRSEALTRMLEVRERSKTETAQFHMRMMKLKVDINHQVKLHNFMEKKLQDIVPVGEIEESKKRKAKTAQQDQIEDEKLETVHRTLLEVTGERDLCQIAKKFIDNEEKNFALFNYINELHNKSNMLNNCIDKLKSDIQLLELENEGHDDQCKSQLKDLEVQLEKQCSLGNSMENECTLVLKRMDQLMTGIADLFAKINPTPVTEKPGCSTHVTRDNVTQIIGILEESFNELLMLLTLANIEEAEQMVLPPQNPLLARHDLLPAVTPSSVEAPSVTDQPASEQPLDFLSLRACVLPSVVQSEQGESSRNPPANQRGKKAGLTFKSA
ncbi:coiled-coil domain-containing protein 63-like [Centroberyx affinis]|uniref:coiled-coil domain-containing protein 63-like n=1 Tax=Centroberyx affinis TaxID=166261 RepID=UPI003A5BC436